MGCSPSTVKLRLREAGMGALDFEARNSEIVRRYRSGESLTQVAAGMGMTKTAVHQVLRKLGVPRRAAGPRRSKTRDGSGVAAGTGYLFRTTT